MKFNIIRLSQLLLIASETTRTKSFVAFQQLSSSSSSSSINKKLSSSGYRFNDEIITTTSSFPLQKHQSLSKTTTTRLFSTQQGTTEAGCVNIDETTPRDIQSFEFWSNECGVQKSDGFTFIQEESFASSDINIGVMTTTNVQAQQPVLFVPSNMVLTGSKVQQELGIIPEITNPNIIGCQLDENTISQFYLFLKIYKEYQLGQQSPYFPWLNSLPRYFSNGSSMTKLCTDLLPPLVQKLTCQEKLRFKQFFHILNKYCGHLGINVPQSISAVELWVFAIVCTRSFPIPNNNNDYHITPMADMFNHGGDESTEIDIQFDNEGNCYAIARYDIPAGSTLRVTYGDPTNPSYLFSRYGFVDESSPATFCKIMIQDPIQELINMGYDHSLMLFYKDGQVSQQVYDVLLYRLLGRIDKNVQQQFYNAHINQDYETKSRIHQQYASQTIEASLKHIDSTLNELEELIDLASMYKDSTDTTHPRLPIINRHNEFVQKTFETVKNRLLAGY